MFEEQTQAVAAATAAVNAALATLAALEADTSTDPAEIAPQRTAAREAVAVCQERLTKARIALASAQVAKLATDAAELRAEAVALDAQAEHAETTARGTVDGLYGADAHRWLMDAGRYPINAQALRIQAANKRGLADQLDDDAKRIWGAK